MLCFSSVGDLSINCTHPNQQETRPRELYRHHNMMTSFSCGFRHNINEDCVAATAVDDGGKEDEKDMGGDDVN